MLRTPGSPSRNAGTHKLVDHGFERSPVGYAASIPPQQKLGRRVLRRALTLDDVGPSLAGRPPGRASSGSSVPRIHPMAAGTHPRVMTGPTNHPRRQERSPDHHRAKGAGALAREPGTLLPELGATWRTAAGDGRHRQRGAARRRTAWPSCSEGIEGAAYPTGGTARIHGLPLVGGLRSGDGYLGCGSIEELQKNARLSASRTRSARVPRSRRDHHPRGAKLPIVE